MTSMRQEMSNMTGGISTLGLATPIPDRKSRISILPRQIFHTSCIRQEILDICSLIASADEIGFNPHIDLALGPSI